MFELNEKNLAHYTIQRRLAQGGMSQVFLAYDEHEKRNVAIKVVNRCEDDYVVRFRRAVTRVEVIDIGIGMMINICKDLRKHA